MFFMSAMSLHNASAAMSVVAIFAVFLTGTAVGTASVGVNTAINANDKAPPRDDNSFLLTRLSPNATQGRCMDGSVGGYYLAPAGKGTPDEHKWVLELQGGGECATAESCQGKQGSSLASSKYFSKSVHMTAGLTQGPPNKLASWNRVHLPYCSQDLWTGTRTAPSPDSFGFYFSGHLILEAVLDALDASGGGSGGLKNATDIVLTGESAGGMGVWPNLDWLAARYPNARVSGAPIAGFYFFAHPYYGPGHTSSKLADFREAAWPGHYELWSSFVDADCAKALPGWHCILANYTYPYIQSKVFITESLTDKVVTLYHDYVPYQDPHWSKEVLAYFGHWKDNMTQGLSPAMDKDSPNGVFAPACFIHTEFNALSPILNGHSYLAAFAEWYAGASVKLQDDCGVLCNPTCAH